MKTSLLAAAALFVAAPAFADDGLEGRIMQPGDVNAVVAIDQFAAGANATGLDAPSLITLAAAQADDDALAIFGLQAAPEFVSTQSFGSTVGTQLLSSIEGDTSGMSLSEAAAAYLYDDQN